MARNSPITQSDPILVARCCNFELNELAEHGSNTPFETGLRVNSFVVRMNGMPDLGLIYIYVSRPAYVDYTSRR